MWYLRQRDGCHDQGWGKGREIATALFFYFHGKTKPGKSTGTSYYLVKENIPLEFEDPLVDIIEVEEPGPEVMVGVVMVPLDWVMAVVLAVEETEQITELVALIELEVMDAEDAVVVGVGSL